MDLILGLIGGILARAKGGWPDIPRPFEQIAFCSILAYALWLFHVPVLLILIACVPAVIVCLKGHGHTMSLTLPVDPSKFEWYERYTGFSKLAGRLPDYWYKALGHALGGLFVTLTPGIALSFYNPIAGLILAICGAVQAPAYMIGWWMHPDGEGGYGKMYFGKFQVAAATEWGEFLFGALLWTFVTAIGGL